MPIEDFRSERIKKLEALKKAGVDPYPGTSRRTHTIADAIAKFDALSEEKHAIVIAGRVMARREHGGLMFLDLNDGTGLPGQETMQVLAKRDKLGDEQFDRLLSAIDIGDFTEVVGTLFLTNRKERTLEAASWSILAKSLLPLPEKWHGLQDADERFRKRYLDLVFNPEVRKKFELRTKIIRELRDFLNTRGFLEVQTPTLQPLYGGASARPFKTHMHTLDVNLFLRVAPELYLKRLLVGGFTDVYEFTTNFRNEGMDRDHNPEFSALEFYAAYRDLEWAMLFTEEMFNDVLERVLGSTIVSYSEQKIHFKRPFVRATFNELLKQYSGLDYDADDEDAFRDKSAELGLTIEKSVAKPGLADEIFKKVIRQNLIQPTFVTQWPADLIPLAKRLPDNKDYVGAFQLFSGGLELIKAFSELNDPIDQRVRLEAQEKRRGKGDEEAQRLDEDFIEALEYGMPPAAGWGLGIDRFVALLTDSHSIREVILFPFMKPKE